MDGCFFYGFYILVYLAKHLRSELDMGLLKITVDFQSFVLKYEYDYLNKKKKTSELYITSQSQTVNTFI